MDRNEMPGKAREIGKKAKDAVVDAARKAGDFAVRNKELVVVAVPVAIAAIRSSQSLIVSRRVDKEQKRKDRSYYDRHTMTQWDLRRKMSNAEKAEVLRRQELGQDTYDILRSMGLLKR